MNGNNFILHKRPDCHEAVVSRNDNIGLSKKKGAFTLAEVLITLSILGVVAAIIIPSIIGHYKKVYTETRLKQAYSILDNAMDMAKAEHGSFGNMINTAMASNNSRDFFGENYLKPYLNAKKTCSSNDPSFNCSIFSVYSPGFNKEPSLDNIRLVDLSGKRQNVAIGAVNDWYRLQLANGINIGVVHMWKCVDEFTIATFAVDINGNKAPNRIGYDIFYFSIFAEGFPARICTNRPNDSSCSQGDRVYAVSWNSYMGYENGKKCEGTGEYCAAVIKRNGWKIPKDYPIKF